MTYYVGGPMHGRTVFRCEGMESVESIDLRMVLDNGMVVQVRYLRRHWFTAPGAAPLVPYYSVESAPEAEDDLVFMARALLGPPC